MKLNTNIIIKDIMIFLNKNENPTFEGVYQLGQMLLIIKQSNNEICFDIADIETITKFKNILIKLEKIAIQSEIDGTTRSTLE